MANASSFSLLLGCLTRSVSPVTACMTRGKKGRGEKSGKREKRRRSSFSLHSGREKRGKRVFLSSQSPSLFTSSFALFDACHTGYGVSSMEQNSVWGGKRRESRLSAHRKLFSGKSEMGSQWIFTYIFNYTKRWRINWPPFCVSVTRSERNAGNVCGSLRLAATVTPVL